MVRQLAAIVPPVAPAILASEVDALGAPLDQIRQLAVYCAPARQIRGVLSEIGRLREISFRAAGEGTGRESDIDEFDAHYLHLFVWNGETHEIVGAYRLAATDEVEPRFGLAGLYTATLFEYSEALLVRLGPSWELGRSFVRPEYQRSFTPLLLLWKGIGRLVARAPHRRVLFGPVSISSRYEEISRQLMISLLTRNFSLEALAPLVRPRSPFSALPVEQTQHLDGANLPVLLRQYLKLGGRLLGFSVDRDFSNVVDGLIVVDLLQTDPRILERYLGRDEAAAFLEYQKGQL